MVVINLQIDEMEENVGPIIIKHEVSTCETAALMERTAAAEILNLLANNGYIPKDQVAAMMEKTPE